MTTCAVLRMVAGLVGLLIATPLSAQTSEAERHSAETITAETLAQQIAALVSDSLWNRTTPSVALERAAKYVMEIEDTATASIKRQFSALMADSLSDTAVVTKVWKQLQLRRWFEPSIRTYTVPGRMVRLNPLRSQLAFSYTLRANNREVLAETGRTATKDIGVSFMTAARFVVPRVPETTSRGTLPPVVLLTGRPTATFLQQTDIAHKAVLYIPPDDLDTATRQTILETLYRTSLGTVLLALNDSAHFAAQQETLLQQPLQLVDTYLNASTDEEFPRPWVVEAQVPAVVEILRNLGVDLAEARTSDAPKVRELPGLRMWLWNEFDTTKTARPVAVPMVEALLQGSDSILAKQCLILTAPLDRRGSHPNAPVTDSLARSADLSTVSLAGLLELVHVFRALDVRPKRSIVFLATSGGAPGQLFWGSHSYLEGRSCDPILSIAIDLSVGGQVTTDTAVFAGLDEVTIGQLPLWVANAHPELQLTVVDGGTVTQPHSDAFAFSRRDVPSLLLQGGLTTDSARGESASTAEAFRLERTARLLRLVFYVSQAVLDSQQRPKWSPTGRQRRFGGR